ncbi:SCO4225 family membrane protein [Streptomyces sp. HUAS ZL42]|uniref:SCO4225 family membrane protein n=1 Tax=Streptomyces sp. HUAS ZL42 TaxID=3231715 RepID=UPI00345EB67E
MTDRSFTRSLRRTHSEVAVLVYLAICAVLLVWALVVTVSDDSGESMAGVIPLLATAPASLVLLALPDDPVWFITAVAIGAEVNAAVIGWCARALRRGDGPDPAS